MTSGYRDWCVEWFPTGETLGEQLQNVLSVRLQRTDGRKGTTAEIVLSNVNAQNLEDGEVKFLPDEDVKIYAAAGIVDKANSEHLMGAYTILNHEIMSDNKTLKLKLADKTYNLLSKIWVGDENDTPPNIIEKIIQTINEDGVTATPIDTDIAASREDDTNFPTVQYFSAYKTAYDVIDELSQIDLTGDDRTYLFWFDENNKFFWKYPSQVIESDEFVFGSAPIYTMKAQKSESEAVAMIIYNAGNDKNGDAFLGFYLDPEAGSIKNRMKYQPMTDISRDLTVQLTRAGTYAGMSNADFQTLLESTATARARAIVQNIGQGLWESVIDVEGDYYKIGDLYNVSDTENGFPKTAQRIKSIIHDLNKGGWVTKLTLVEDAETI